MQLALILMLLLVPVIAWAQEPLPVRALVLALQQMGVATEQYITDTKAQMAAKDARIAELEKLCGDLCKAK